MGKRIIGCIQKASRQALGRRSGFTLVEMVIVLAVLGITTAIATPNMIDWLRQQGVRYAADQLLDDFQRAKLLAIERNTNCSVTIDKANNRYTISIVNEVVNLGTFRGGVAFTDSPAATDAVITFTPQGICNPAGQVLFTNADGTGTFRVRTSVAGGVSRHRWAGGSWI